MFDMNNHLLCKTHSCSNITQAQQTMLDYLQLPELNPLTGKYNTGTVHITYTYIRFLLGIKSNLNRRCSPDI